MPHERCPDAFSVCDVRPWSSGALHSHQREHARVLSSQSTGHAQRSMLLPQRLALKSGILARSPLQIASAKGDARVVTALLRAAAADESLEQDLLQADSHDGMTPLGWAAQNNQQATALLLLSHMPERQVLRPNAFGCIPLVVAAMAGHAGLCQLLLQFAPEQQLMQVPTDADFACFNGPAALRAAVGDDHADTVKVLLAHVPERQVLHEDSLVSSVLRVAVRRNAPRSVAALLQHATAQQVSMQDDKGWTALHCAAQHGYACIVQQLLAAHNPARQVLWRVRDGRIAMHMAVEGGHTDTVRQLLTHSPHQQLAHQDMYGANALMHVAGAGNAGLVQLLLSCAREPEQLVRQVSKTNHTPLMAAARKGSAAAVQLLLQHIPDWQVQQVDDFGNHALAYALDTDKQSNCLQVVRLLLCHSPEVQVQRITGHGMNALTFALKLYWLPIARELLKHCPALQVVLNHPSGESPLAHAVAAADAGLVQELLRHVTDPALLATGLLGATILIRCSLSPLEALLLTKAYVRCYKLLLDAGADPTILTADQLAAIKRTQPAVQKLVRDACERRWKEQRQAQELQAKAAVAAAALLAEEEADRAKAQAAQAKKDKKKQKKATAKAQKAAAQADQEGGGGGAGEDDGAATAAGVSDAEPSHSSGGSEATSGAGGGSSCGGGQDGVEGVGSGANGNASALKETVAGVDAHPLSLATQHVSSSSCEDDRWCVVCLERHSCRALVPCGHIIMCGPCCEAVQAAKNECPMCRQDIEAVLVVNL